MASPRPNNPDTYASIEAFVDSAMDAFELAGPVYQFGFCPAEDSNLRARLGRISPEGVCDGFGRAEAAEVEPLPFADGVARTVLYVDAPGRGFESRRILEEMIRILSPGGALLVCASVAAPLPNRAPARWRLTPGGLDQLLCGMQARLVGWEGAENVPQTLYAVGLKPPLDGSVLQGINRFLERFPARIDQLARERGWGQRLKQLLAGCAASRWVCPGWRDRYKLQFVFSVEGKLDHELLEGCLPSGQTGARLDLIE